MPQTPDVTIVLPVHNDEEWVATALQSCLSQTWRNFEVICVDDASTDGTTAIIAALQQSDSRVRLHKQRRNRTAFQARKVGIDLARAPFILFLDGDDQLDPEAVASSLALAQAHEADVVGFGVEVVAEDGRKPGRFAAELQPRHAHLEGEAILPGLFPAGKPAQGHLWRYLWKTDLLREAYELLPSELELPRANDIPIAFLGVALAKRYASTAQKLYRYYWRRGVSGQASDDAERFQFYLRAMDSIDAIRGGVDLVADRAIDGAEVKRCYELARLSTIYTLLRRCEQVVHPEAQQECVSMLLERVGELDAVRAASTFAMPMQAESVLSLLIAARSRTATVRRPVRTVMITTGNIQTGGVQGVVISQARILLESGVRVVIVVRSIEGVAFELPAGAEVFELSGATRAEKIIDYLRLCRDHDVDVIIDHHILYNNDWPFYSLSANAVGVPTIGWLHSFALRPLFDANTRSSSLAAALPTLLSVVVLSETDVAYWKLLGVERVYCLPNPPSPMLLDGSVASSPRPAPDGRLELVWWGRLHQQTKRVRELIEVAAALHSLNADFHLTIIGPDSGDTSAQAMRAMLHDRGLDSLVTLAGPLHGEDLTAAISRAHIYISTSAIEGYPLSLIEAQAMGFPVVMYDLPWLAVLEGNGGVSTVPQGRPNEIALKVLQLAGDTSEYKNASAASLEAARSALSADFKGLYRDLLNDRLPPEYSPAPTVGAAKMLLELAVAYSEVNIRSSRRREQRQSERIRELRKMAVRMKRQVVELRGSRSALKRTSSGVSGRRALVWLARRARTVLRRISQS